MVKSLDIQKKGLRARPAPVSASEKYVKPKTKSFPSVLSGRKRFWIKVIVLALCVLVGGGYSLGFLILPKATLAITTRTEPVARDFEITIDVNQKDADAEQLVVPGRFIDQEVSNKKNVESTGTRNAGQRASGFVTIYNFSKTTLILKKDTTVLSVNGKRYFFTQDVGNIRPTAKIGLEDEEIDPTSLIPPVPIASEGGGEQYNLACGVRIEIKNDAFGSQPQLLYAVTSDAISGGTNRLIKMVTQGDIDKGQDQLTTELVENAKTSLTADSPGAKIIEGALITEIVAKTSSSGVNAEVPQFEVSQTVRLHALVYNENDIRSMVAERIKRLQPENKILQEEGAQLSSRFIAINLQEGKGVLSNHFESTLRYSIDAGKIIDQIRGRDIQDIRDILLSMPEIEQVEVVFSPSWVKKAPNMKSKIKINWLN